MSTEPQHGWFVVPEDDGVHVTPVADMRAHAPHKGCWCDPRIEDTEGADVVVHNSVDERELFETGKRLPS